MSEQPPASNVFTKSLLASKTFWSVVGSVTALITAATPILPDRYRPLAKAIGEALAALAVLFNRQASVNAAREGMVVTDRKLASVEAKVDDTHAVIRQAAQLPPAEKPG